MLSQNTFMKTGLLLMIIGSVSGCPFSKQNDTLEQRLTSLERGMKKVNTRLQLVEDKLETMRSRLEDKGECQGFVEDGKCFTVIITGASKISYFDAKRTCGSDGVSKLGNIDTRTQFDNLTNHIILRQRETSANFITVWTDMTRDTRNGVVRLSNGQTPAYIGIGDWRDEYFTGITNIYVSFWTGWRFAGPPDYTVTGIYKTGRPTYGGNAALCERAYKT